MGKGLGRLQETVKLSKMAVKGLQKNFYRLKFVL